LRGVRHRFYASLSSASALAFGFFVAFATFAFTALAFGFFVAFATFAFTALTFGFFVAFATFAFAALALAFLVAFALAFTALTFTTLAFATFSFGFSEQVVPTLEIVGYKQTVICLSDVRGCQGRNECSAYGHSDGFHFLVQHLDIST